MISFGPAKGDLYHWNFETVDIACTILHKGNNIIAAVVWNFGDEKPVWQISYANRIYTVQGNTNSRRNYKYRYNLEMYAG